MTHWTNNPKQIEAAILIDCENDLYQLGIERGIISPKPLVQADSSLEDVVKAAQSMGMKIALVVYDDGDTENKNGPVVPWAFRECWEKLGKPITGWDLDEMRKKEIKSK